MHQDLETRRMVLLTTYRRYIEADRAWVLALREMEGWFPPQSRPYRTAIGDPGSPVRRLYERRERAILQLETARMKLEEARRRLRARSRAAEAPLRLSVVILPPRAGA